MDECAWHRVGVDVPSLIAVLSDHLYTTPEVAIRELVANSRDAVIRRRGSGEPFEPCIRLRTNQAQHALLVGDNGAGMTTAEVRDCLSTIAGSATRSAALAGDTAGLDDAPSGLFGIGFYASLIWAHRIEVLTRGAEGALYRWVCEKTAEAGGRQQVGWRLEQVPEELACWEGPGTEVTLHLDAQVHDHPLLMAYEPGPRRKLCSSRRTCGKSGWNTCQGLRPGR